VAQSAFFVHSVHSEVVRRHTDEAARPTTGRVEPGRCPRSFPPFQSKQAMHA